MSRELSTCSFRERKLGGKLGKLGGKLGKEKLNGQGFEQRDKEARINAGRIMLCSIRRVGRRWIYSWMYMQLK